MKKGIVIATFGFLLIAASLIFSNKYFGDKGLLWNLTHTYKSRSAMEIVFVRSAMELVFAEGEYCMVPINKVYDNSIDPTSFKAKGYEAASRNPSLDAKVGKDEKGYFTCDGYEYGYIGRIAIPTRYPFFIGVVIVIIGFAIIALGLTSKSSNRSL